MSESLLKPIKSLRSSSDLRSFSQVRPLDLSNFFPSLWHSLLELLIVNKFYHIALQVLANTIYFYPQSNNSTFEKAHSRFISEFTSALNKQDQSKSKSLLNHDSLWSLLQDIAQFIPTDPDSRIAPLQPLLFHVKISVIEKTDDYEDFPWKVEDPVLTVSLFENEKEFFLLHPKTKLNLPELLVSDEALTTDEGSPLEKPVDSDVLCLERDSDNLEMERDEEESGEQSASPRKGNCVKEEEERNRNAKEREEKREIEKEWEVLEVAETVEEAKIEEEVKIAEVELEEEVKGSRFDEMTEEVEEYQEEPSEVVLEPASFCGASLCARCSKELWRTSHFLVNTSCCYKNIYNSRVVPIPSGSAPEKVNKDCMFCDKPAGRPNNVYCVCCFLHMNVWNTKNYKGCEGCRVLDMNHWVDISEGREIELMQCSFCDEFRHKHYMCQACVTCGDVVCLACLRKNSFISEGICSGCHTRRKISLVYGKLRPS